MKSAGLLGKVLISHDSGWYHVGEKNGGDYKGYNVIFNEFLPLLNEQGFNRDWIERQLAHAERNEVRAAYNAAEWLVYRRNMLTWWSEYLDAAAEGQKANPCGQPIQ